ncbi:hypothetical protein DBR42_09840 [Pelomonas sp. HMWF004]|nr:hypothetical protein DBR42_09840 [Pelomonas sp. HMWF004]
MNMTGDTRDHDDAAEAACHAAATAASKTADQADNCEDGEHRCPSCPWADPLRDGAEAVAVEAFRHAMAGGHISDLYKLPARCAARVALSMR